MTRYCYAYGYRTREAAQDALDDLYASGEVSPGELPQIQPYRTSANATRYSITLVG